MKQAQRHPPHEDVLRSEREQRSEMHPVDNTNSKKTAADSSWCGSDIKVRRAEKRRAENLPMRAVANISLRGEVSDGCHYMLLLAKQGSRSLSVLACLQQSWHTTCAHTSQEV